MQLADAGRSPGGESSWPELVNIANGVSCSNTQQHHWSRQWDRAPGVTAAYCCSFGFELSLGAQHSTQCATLRSAPLYKKAQCHTMTRGETTLDHTSKYQQYNVNTSSNCCILWSRAGPSWSVDMSCRKTVTTVQSMGIAAVLYGSHRVNFVPWCNDTSLVDSCYHQALSKSHDLRAVWYGLIWFDHRVAQLSAVGFTDRRLSR